MSKDKKKCSTPEIIEKEEPKKIDIRKFLKTADGLNVEILKDFGEGQSKRCGKGVVKTCHNVDGDKPELVIIDETKGGADSGFILEVNQCEIAPHNWGVIILDTISKYYYRFQSS